MVRGPSEQIISSPPWQYYIILKSSPPPLSIFRPLHSLLGSGLGLLATLKVNSWTSFSVCPVSSFSKSMWHCQVPASLCFRPSITIPQVCSMRLSTEVCRERVMGWHYMSWTEISNLITQALQSALVILFIFPHWKTFTTRRPLKIFSFNTLRYYYKWNATSIHNSWSHILFS